MRERPTVVSVVDELTDQLDTGRHAEYADGFTVMNWLVVGLKLLGAVVACCRSRTVRDGRRRGCSR